MEWVTSQLDRLLSWYADQNAFIKLCCWLPCVIGLIGLVCLYFLSFRTVNSSTASTAEAVNKEVRTVLNDLDKQIKDASIKIKCAQDRQNALHDQLEGVTDNTTQLKKRVSVMSHEELKQFVNKHNAQDDANEWGEYTIPRDRK